MLCHATQRRDDDGDGDVDAAADVDVDGVDDAAGCQLFEWQKETIKRECALLLASLGNEGEGEMMGEEREESRERGRKGGW